MLQERGHPSIPGDPSLAVRDRTNRLTTDACYIFTLTSDTRRSPRARTAAFLERSGSGMSVPNFARHSCARRLRISVTLLPWASRRTWSYRLTVGLEAFRVRTYLLLQLLLYVISKITKAHVILLGASYVDVRLQSLRAWIPIPWEARPFPYRLDNPPRPSRRDVATDAATRRDLAHAANVCLVEVSAR
jgi:hypothetical protein